MLASHKGSTELHDVLEGMDVKRDAGIHTCILVYSALHWGFGIGNMGSKINRALALLTCKLLKAASVYLGEGVLGKLSFCTFS